MTDVDSRVAGTPAPSRAAFAFIFVTVLLDMMALGVIIPVLPKLIKAFMGGDTASAAHVVGYFGFAWALMQFIFQPVLGALSDRFGRRPVIILSNVGLGLDYILMAVAPNLWFLFVGRLISGITAASFSTAGAYIADVTPPEKRAARFGLLGAAFGLGFVIGPAVGGLLGEVNLHLPFWGAAVLSLINALYGFLVLPESLARERRAEFSWHRANPIGSLKLLGSNPILSRLAIAGFLQRFAHGSLPSMFVLYADYRYGWSAKAVGLALAGVGVSQMIVSGGLVRPAIAKVGERGTLMLGLICGTVGFLIYGFAPTGLIFLAALPLVALWGLANPAIQSLATRRVGPSEQGQLQGAQSSLGGIADMVGPLLFSQVFAAAIASNATAHIPGAPYYLAALFVAGALCVCWQVTRPLPAMAE
ncbi:MAG: transporter [Rhodospirillales bacterium]|nr:transporter [Rhodospirillales bacterium]